MNSLLKQKQSVLNNGYNFIMITNKNYFEFEKLFPVMFI